jgi:hypothetical protein
MSDGQVKGLPIHNKMCMKNLKFLVCIWTEQGKKAKTTAMLQYATVLCSLFPKALQSKKERAPNISSPVHGSAEVSAIQCFGHQHLLVTHQQLG